ncbi:hypothetical protein CTRI78_v008005 [Colletotrichum trifolii]|uniref:Fungal N-terminal domain-containing protein n=1 Tax=Colletotrichum trifolii TaxID=5466 RepID=A0A4R8R8M2_COLTR|nr:hypothetical protein CTRI78_v008005 [Colletotrichum trifolii]
MAEILGTVVGVVSLGIQVCSGVYTYLDGIQGRKEDVDSATRLCRSMELLLMRLQGLQARITASSAAGAATIQGAMEAAKEELGLLDKLSEQLRAIEGPSSSIGEKLKNQKARLLYPFRRDHMERLESRLRNSNEAVQSALQAVQLELSLNTGDALSTIETAVLTSHTELAGTLSNVHLMSSQGQSSMLLISEDVSTMSSQLRTFLPQARRQMDRSLTVMSEVQQHATDSLSTLAEIRTMAEFSAAGINEMRDIFQTLRPSSPRDLCQKLVSKPEALQMACRNADFAHHPDIVRPSAFGGSKSVAMNGFKCHCHLRRSAKTTQRQFGPGFLQHRVASNKTHRTDCIYAQFNDASSTWTLGLSARAFRVAISAAITVTMSSMSGAGGLGISPSLTVLTVRESSPAEDLELWEEDAALIELLESLVAEFEAKLDEMACQLSHFMKTYWAARMEQVEEELEEQRMTKENREGIEELGITLQVDEDSVSEDSVFEQLKYVYRGADQPEYWLKKIADIRETTSGM